MRRYIQHFVRTEHEPFCFNHLLRFNYEGIWYGMTHGTVRNYIKILKDEGFIEEAYPSYPQFYTLTGHKFKKPMTLNPAVVKNFNSNKFYNFLQNVPLNQRSIHNVRMKFKVSNSNSDIWELVSSLKSESGTPKYAMKERNYAIRIPTWYRDYTYIGTLIHKTNTVEITFACSTQLFINSSSVSPVPLKSQSTPTSLQDTDSITTNKSI